MEDGSTRLAVANGQIRRGRLRYQVRDALWTVSDVGDDSATIQEDGHESTSGITIEDLSRWPCVGLVTPAGRVMVGERRQGSAAVATVVRVVDDLYVEADVSGLAGPRLFQAVSLASWPLLPPAPAPSKTGPLARLCAHVAHTLGLPIGEVTAEETPRDGMIRVSVPASVTGLRCDEAWERAREMLPVGIALSVKPRRADPGLGAWRAQESGGPGAWRDPDNGDGIGAHVQHVPDVTGGDGYWLWEVWGPRKASGASGGHTSGHVATQEAARKAADSAAVAMGWTGPGPLAIRPYHAPVYATRKDIEDLALTWDRVSIGGIERRRRCISAVLAEDARRFPAFADARRAFVLSAFERTEPCPERARGLVAMCHTYERKRGAMRRPSAEAVKYADGCDFYDDYERARGLLSPVAEVRPDVVETWEGWALP